MSGDTVDLRGGRLKRRSEFLWVAKGARHHGPRMSIQMAPRAEGGDAPARIGLTVTRKVGTAVERNRVKRRLREALAAPHRGNPGSGCSGPAPGRPGHDYVIVGRRDLLHAPFACIVEDILRGLDCVHRSAWTKPVARASRAQGPQQKLARQDDPPRPTGPERA